MMLQRLVLPVILIFFGLYPAYADQYEITLHQINPDGAITHTRTCPVDQACARALEFPVQVGESGMLLDVAFVIKPKVINSYFSTLFKADNKTLTISETGLSSFGEILEKDGLSPQKIRIYAPNPATKNDTDIPTLAVVRPLNHYIADVELSVRRIP